MSLSEWRCLVFNTLGLIVIFGLSKSSFKSYKATLVAFIWLGLFYLLVQGWVITGGLSFWKGYWSVEGLIAAGYMIWRIGLVFLLTGLFIEITPPLEQSRGIAFFMSPFTRISKVGGDITLLITLTLRFIPLFIEEGKAIWLARWLKGEWPKSYLIKVKELARLIPPIILLTLRRAEEVAENLIARGYTSGNYRFVNFGEWKMSDSLALLFLGVWALCVLLLNWLY